MVNKNVSIWQSHRKVPDRMVRELVIGQTAGGGMLETLRIEVNTCES